MNLRSNETAARLCALVARSLLWASLFSGAARADCAFGSGEKAVLRGVDARLQPVLADGRVIAPPDIETPDALDASWRAALAALVQGAGGDVTLDLVRTQPDRWGRTLARLIGRGPDPHAAWVEKSLVAAGLARVDPRWESPPCDRELLASEDLARQMRAGLWSSPNFALINANAPRGGAFVDGAFVVVEGRIVDVGAAGSLLYLNFGRDRWRDLTLVARKSVAEEFAASGAALSNGAGRRVRARGRIKFSYGPRLELARPEQIEWLEPGLAR